MGPCPVLKHGCQSRNSDTGGNRCLELFEVAPGFCSGLKCTPGLDPGTGLDQSCKSQDQSQDRFWLTASNPKRSQDQSLGPVPGPVLGIHFLCFGRALQGLSVIPITSSCKAAEPRPKKGDGGAPHPRKHGCLALGGVNGMCLLHRVFTLIREQGTIQSNPVISAASRGGFL